MAKFLDFSSLTFLKKNYSLTREINSQLCLQSWQIQHLLFICSTLLLLLPANTILPSFNVICDAKFQFGCVLKPVDRAFKKKKKMDISILLSMNIVWVKDI